MTELNRNHNTSYAISREGYASVFDKKLPDPDALPALTLEEIDNLRRGNKTYTWLDRQTEADVITDYVHNHSDKIRRIIAHTGLSMYGHGRGVEKISAIVNTPILMPDETPERVARTAHTIAEAASMLDAPVIFMPWLNFTLDPRREQDKAVNIKEALDQTQEAILDTINGYNVVPRIAIDHLPYGTTISAIRQRMSLAALHLVYRRHTWDREREAGKEASELLYYSQDADTEISKNGLVVIKRALDLRKALLVSGNLQYTGGVMDKSVEELKEESAEMRLLYIAEHIRRWMTSHLPPTTTRGYLSEASYGTKLSTIVGLKGFDDRAKDNESYGLELNALRAVNLYFEEQSRKKRGSVDYTLKERVANPYVAGGILAQIESITRYENYTINTSIEGVQTQVENDGVSAIIGFDHGQHYTMRTLAGRNLQGRREQQKFAPLEIINSVFSYYRDLGGELTREGLLTASRLVRDLGFVDEGELVPGLPAWIPEYVPKEKRPVSSNVSKY